MIARFVWMNRILLFGVVSALAFSNAASLTGSGIALAAAPSSAGCSPAAAQVSAGAPKQAALQALAPSSCPSGLVALWKMEETSGTTFVDSANGHNGACAPGECPISATGVVSNALSFSSATTVTVPSSTAFDFALSDSFTLEAWIKPSTVCSGAEPAIGRSSTNGVDFQWWLGCETGKAELIVKDTNLVLGFALGTSTIANGNFHHVVGVQDAGANQLRLYVDGALEATTPTSYTAGFGSGTPIYLGWYKAAQKYHFSGDLDEVAVYNRALTAQEIADHHTRGLAGHGICDVIGIVFDHFLYLPLVTK